MEGEAMTRPSVLILLVASILVAEGTLRWRTSESRPAPPKEAKDAEPKMSLVFANRLHRHFYETCDLPHCKVRYAGELGFDMPKKTFVLDYNYKQCSCWEVYYLPPGEQSPQFVTVFHFRLEKCEDELAGTKIDGQLVYCYLAKHAHDDTPEVLRKRADQPIPAFAKVEKLKDTTPRQIAGLLLR
jgi:hypothetical protein